MWESNSRAKKYFQNEDDYDDAMVLFQKFNQLKKLSFEDVQGQLLDSMDEWQDYLLNQATDYVESKALENGDHALLEEAKRVQNLQAQNYLINKNISINSIAIDEAFDDFINQCKNSWKKNSSIENSFRKSYYPILKAVTGEIQTGDITKQHIINFKKIV
jgi:endo-alpha-1,4-polygalactosaminidase (GH114 family)